MNESQEKPLTIGQFIAFVTCPTVHPVCKLPEDESWEAMITRLHRVGTVQEIDEETWWYFLEVLPPKLQGRGWYMFAEGHEPWRLFFCRAGQYLCRPLHWSETVRIQELVRAEVESIKAAGGGAV